MNLSISKEKGFLGLYEANVTLSDFLISLVCLIGIIALLRLSPLSIKQYFVIGLYTGTFLASTFGAIVHGFFEKEEGMLFHSIWKSILLVLVLNGGMLLVLSMHYQPWFQVSLNTQLLAGGIYSIIGILWVLFKSAKFKDALLFYIPMTLLLFFIILIQMISHGSKSEYFYASGAIVFTLLAGFAQFAGLAIKKIHLDHNTLYHLIQIIALVFVYYWGKFA